MKRVVVALVMMASFASSVWAADSQVSDAKADSIAAAAADSIKNADMDYLAKTVAKAIKTANLPVEHDHTSVITSAISDSIIPIFIAGIMPICVIGIVFWFLAYKEKERTKVIQSAIEHGQDISNLLEKKQEENAHLSSKEEIWKKGIRNVAIGIALFFCLFFVVDENISTFGLFPLCLGIGQMVIAKTIKDPQDKQDGLNNPIQNDTEA
ncbi:MAG: hypothetical protein HUJ98_06740 [Bacteroidaceae bacterium]|nr:hypothetical protein [Bacteroidaceae bacterium]MCF0186167.1 hypothetical protein [Bacteroidaceae bacterium]